MRKKERSEEGILFSRLLLERMKLKLKRSKIFRQRVGPKIKKEKKEEKERKGIEWPVSNRLKICIARCTTTSLARLELKENSFRQPDVNTDQTLKLLEFD